MANIPIEKTPSRSLLLPLLALLALLLVGFLVMRGCSDRPTGADQTTPADTSGRMDAGGPAMPDTAAGAGEIVSLDDFAVDDLRPLVGRRVRLNDVNPTRVTGDSTFFLEGTQGKSLMAVLQDLDEAEPGSPDGRYTIRTGQRLNVAGTVEAYPPADTVVLNADDRAALRRQGIYLRVHRVGGPDVRRN